jgi:hypothetical protein
LFLPAGAESTTVQKLQERFAKNRLLVTVVVFERKSGLTDADNAAIQAKAAELAQAPGLDGAISRPFPSEDGKAAQILLPVCGADPYRAGNAVKEIRAVANAGLPHGLQALTTGPGGYHADFPEVFGGIDGLLLLITAEVPKLTELLGSEPLAFVSWTFYRDDLAASFVLFFGAVLVGLLFVVTVPRVLNLAIKPDKVYHLYGFHYGIHRAIRLMTNMRFFMSLFGDSSYIVHYLRCLGYDLSRVVQTGSNFGMEVKHKTPYLSSVGSGTVVADGLSIINADFSSTSFRVSRASIGPHNFLGNNVA